MRNFTVLLISFVFVSTWVSAQYRNVTEEQKKDLLERITKVSNEMNSMQCEFTQVRELSFMDDKITSEGKMYFKKPNKIRWEYIKPYQYVFSSDGQNIRITSGDKTNTVPANQSKLFGEISKVIVGGVSGSGLVDSPDFNVQFLAGNDDFKVVLTPQKKEVKDLFSAIQLFIGKQDNRIRSVELVEKGGDKTTITLKNLQVNTAINDETFK